MLTLKFHSGETVTVTLKDNILTRTYLKMLKHLQHVKLEEYPTDNPYRHDVETVINELLTYAKLLNINIDQSRFTDQQYLNYLHKIYEKNYNGSYYWMHYQEAIHIVEHVFVEHMIPGDCPHTHIDYREFAGKLKQPFDDRYRDLFETNITAGTVCVDWTELGKIPYDYWMNREVEDLNRMYELMKPWTGIKPKLKIFVRDRNMIPDDVDQFDIWFEQFKQPWLAHWGLKEWTHKDIFGRPPIGHLDDLEKFDSLLKNKDWVQQILLK
jgi:hypothetical protein